MGRIRASADIVPLSLPDAVPETVFASLKDAIVASGSDVLFVSDTILCHGVWSLAQTDPDCFCVELISQTHPAEFSFRNGFMVREGDAKLIEMLRWAQQEVFRSSSKTKHILEHLVIATRNWQSGIDGWSQTFFIIDQECIAELAPTRRHRQAILEYVRDSAADIIQIDCESES